MSGCDSLVVARTDLAQSWTNPAERLVAVLNLALSNCALARELMDDEFENNMKKCGSMTSVRKLSEKLDPQAKEVFQARASVDIPVVVRNEIAHDDTNAHTGNSMVDVAFAPYASLSALLLMLPLLLMK